jgi:Predicted transcriptional regulators
MRRSISEMARECGVSVRTLHYYDQVGLLRPAAVSEESGYRWYDDAEVCRLQQILFYRELDFPLREIAAILSSPNYDAQEALRRQRELLTLKRRRLDRLLDLLDANLKGERTMDFSGFSTEELEAARSAYAAEAERRWGGTEAWRVSQERAAESGREDREAFRRQSNEIFRRFAALRSLSPAAPEAQAAVADWQSFLNERCYPCSRELLAGLGAMYTGDERFRSNLNRFGEGTAEFMSAAIAVFCKN